MSKHGQLYNEWLTHNTMDRYMSDHKDRMEHNTEVEEVNYETREYDGIKWIRYDHYEHALHHQLQKARSTELEMLLLDDLPEEVVFLVQGRINAIYHSELDQDSSNTN